MTAWDGSPSHSDPVDDYHGRPSSWRDHAACRGQDVNLWFPEKNRTARDAKAVCEACPVRVECLDEAQSLGETGRIGIWGGLAEKERRALRRKARSAA
jgi:WhiB family redox-sensing transcriptional regulator